MAAPLDFSKNQTFLNPSLPRQENSELLMLAEQGFQELNLARHVALATSGSSRLTQHSLKLVFLSEDALMNSAEAVNRHLQITASDVWGLSLPTFHVGGLGILIRAQLKGNPVFSYPKWEPLKFADFLKEKKISLVSLVPTQVFDLAQAGIQAPGSLRALLVGGAALSSEIFQKARQLGWPLLPSYGMTETSSQIATAQVSDLNLSDMPLPKLLDHVSVENVLDQFYVRSKSVLTAYGQIQNSENIFWNPKDEEGRFPLEDRILLTDQRVQVIGRQNDYFKISGESLMLSQLQSDLEKVLLKLKLNPQNFYLSYLEDPRTGAKVVLYATSLEKMDTICDEYRSLVLPVAKVREVIQVIKIPRNELGKVQIESLKDQKK